MAGDMMLTPRRARRSRALSLRALRRCRLDRVGRGRATLCSLDGSTDASMAAKWHDGEPWRRHRVTSLLRLFRW